jgi:hypothetical protein
MQDNVLTLAVDELNDTNTVDHVFTRFEEYQNRSIYISADHELTARDILGLYRTFPKQNGNFKGTGKCSMKFTCDKSVEGVDGVASLTSPIIAEVSFSVPVGATVADQMIARQKLIALLDDDAIMVDLMNQLMV